MKTVPAPLLLATAVLGVAVGLGTGYLTRCPEANYPQCYHETIENGFNLFDGIQYTLTPVWTDDGLNLTLTSNVMCPYEAQLRVVVPSVKAGTPYLAYPFTADIQFENGQAKIKNIALPEVLPNTELAIFTSGRMAEESQTFHITKVLYKEIVSQNIPVTLRKP